MNDHLLVPSQWAPFGSVLTDGYQDISVGRCDSRHGVTYRWSFADGFYACAAYVDGRIVKETGVLVRMHK